MMVTKKTGRVSLLAITAIGLSGCSLGPAELLIIFAIVVLLFGATRLPQLGRALGETVKSFRKGSGVDSIEDKKTDTEVVKIEEAKVEPADDKKEGAS